MPLYEYECPKCKKVEELLLSHSEVEGFEVICDEPCLTPLKRILSPSNARLLGTGWYRPSLNQKSDD